MVTLVVPICNMEDHLPRCVASIQNQTCRDFEVILVDDGSTDSSGTLCDGYAAGDPERFRVIHKPNGGLSSARNAGIDAARGEWIVFPDPDDWLEPDYVEAFLSLQRQHQAELVCLGHYVDTADATEPSCGRGGPRLIQGRDCSRSVLLGPAFQGFSWNKLYRLDLIRSKDLRFPDDMGTTEDLYFTYRYLTHCSRIVHASERRVYHYCQWEDSTTHSGYSPRKLGSLRTFELIVSDCRERDPELARAAEEELCNFAVNLVWLLADSGQRDRAVMSDLRKKIFRTLPGLLRSRTYGIGRKSQAVLALVSPGLFVRLKNAVRNSKTAAAQRQA